MRVRGIAPALHSPHRPLDAVPFPRHRHGNKKREGRVAYTNWAGNLTYGATRVVAPETIAAAQEIVRSSAKLRVVGSRHCFNAIADTDGVHLSLEKMRGIVSLDKAKRQVVVAGGARYGDISPQLHAAGFALHNLASLPHISIAGATATATHGSGVNLRNLAGAVAAIEFIDGRGDLVTIARDKDGDTFAGAVVNLGALGVVTKLTLDVEPSYDVRQDLYLDLPVAAVEAEFDAIMSAGTSVSLFTDWQGDTIDQVWIKSRTDGGAVSLPPTFHGARPATENLHPLAGFSAEPCTDQMGVPGPWFARLPHFKMEFTPSSGAEIQAEYFVAREDAVAGICALRPLAAALKPVLMISEIRTIAADDLWLSPAWRRDVVAFHFTCQPDWPALQPVLGQIEAALAPFAPLPHWGKQFTLSPATIQSRYPRLEDFLDLAALHDPAGKFRNAFVDRYVFGGG